ncbi:DUF1349 domain-containing protein [candidate division KSB1 bacterium]|nr:DUF1349 domain-containing protein [candidate division KSB1 bacterium]
MLRGEKWKKFTPTTERADFYVSPSGNDAWSGKLAEPNKRKSDGPFATIARAQQAVIELKQAVFTEKEPPVETRYIGSPHKFGDGKDILVLIHDGFYELDEPLTFLPEDGGERCETNMPSGAFEYHKLKDFYVTYAAYPNEKPVIAGGFRLKNWERAGKTWIAKTKNENVEKLVANGSAMTLARTPNEGFFTPAETPVSTEYFKFRDGELRDWSPMQDNRVIMLLRWHTGNNALAKIDTENNIAYLQKPEEGIVVSPPRYYVENIPALLDAQGEWFFDKKKQELQFIPPENLDDPNQAIIFSPQLDQLVKITGERDRPVRNLRIYGLTFQGTKAGKNAISYEYSNGCELIDCTISAVGGQAVTVQLGNYNTRILNNTIFEAENGGIYVLGNPRPENWADIIQETRIESNYVERCGGTSIFAHDALNTTIARNEVTRNLGRYPIKVGGWSNLEEAVDGGYIVEYNHVHHVQERADDSGALCTAGLTHNSILRRNLIHDVKAGMFNDNVAIWFDNMSLGWTAEENIIYNLEQGEMKLCAANLVDNIYRNNYRIEAPQTPPEGKILGEPKFEFGEMQLTRMEDGATKKFRTGDMLQASITVRNTGSTGIESVPFFIDGRLIEKKNFPIIRGNERQISYEFYLTESGEHRVAIGSAKEVVFKCKGKPVTVICDSLTSSATIVPAGETVTFATQVQFLNFAKREIPIHLLIDDKQVATQNLVFQNENVKNVQFRHQLPAGSHEIKIGNSPTITVKAYAYDTIDISKSEFQKYCTVRAAPCDMQFDRNANTFSLKTSGTDFYHGEDSYGAIYCAQPIKGNFVATVKVKRFGKRTNEWFRAGLFARNDITDSFESEAGSLGSVLMFVTPGRAGMNWDEYGDGCMHKANSQNHDKTEPYPMWIKLERHGDSFSGYVSYDGENWTVSRHTADIPGLNAAIHLGLAAGSPDQKQYTVEFEDLQLRVEKEGWSK